MKILKTIWNWIVFLFTHKGEIADEAVSKGWVDYSGQGRNKNGR